MRSASASSKSRQASSTTSRRQFSPKKTTSGLSTPPQNLAAGDSEGAQALAFELGVSVGGELGVDLRPARIEAGEARLERGAWAHGVAAEAADALEGAVELDHVIAAGAVMEPVDVLGDHPVDASAALERREGVMAGVGLGAGKASPSDEGARPVSLSRFGALHEGAVLDGIARAAARLGAAVVGDAALGAHARAGEDDEALASEERSDGADVGGRLHADTR